MVIRSPISVQDTLALPLFGVVKSFKGATSFVNIPPDGDPRRQMAVEAHLPQFLAYFDVSWDEKYTFLRNAVMYSNVFFGMKTLDVCFRRNICFTSTFPSQQIPLVPAEN